MSNREAAKKLIDGRMDEATTPAMLIEFFDTTAINYSVYGKGT